MVGKYKNILGGAFCMTICMLLVCLQPILAEDPHVVTINNSDWPPYFFAEQPDAPKGLAVELLEMCLPQTGYEYVFKHYPIKRMQLYMEQGKLDINVYSYEKSRESFLVYGKEPLFFARYRPVVLAEKGIQIRSLQDFDNLTLGHLAGLRYSNEFFEYVKERERKGSLVTAVSQFSLLKMLLTGKIDVFVDTEASIVSRARHMQVLDQINILKFDIKRGDYFVTLSKQSKAVEDKIGFLENFDRCLRVVKKGGKYAEIMRKYGLE